MRNSAKYGCTSSETFSNGCKKIKKRLIHSAGERTTQRRRRVASAAKPNSAAIPGAGTAKVDVSFSETLLPPDVMPLMCTTKSQAFTPLNTDGVETPARAAEVPLTENTQVPDCPFASPMVLPPPLKLPVEAEPQSKSPKGVALRPLPVSWAKLVGADT